MHIFETPALVLPTRECDTLGRRHEPDAVEHSFAVTNQPFGNIACIADDGGNQDNLRLRA